MDQDSTRHSQGQPGQGGHQPAHAPQQQQHGNKSQQDQQRSKDQGKVGQDTDGDGKVVKPGQTPGQSHGKGLK